MIIVKCENIKKYFLKNYFPLERGYLRGKTGVVKAVDGVSLNIEKGETFGLVGESGSGKTTVGKLILGILKADSGRIELATRRPQVIFQDPYNSLDPKMRIKDILSEGLILRKESSGIIKKRIEGALDLVKLPEQSLLKYPHQFSGGERQRIAIARAVLTHPEFIVCDEPVSSLDITVQVQILRLLKELQKRLFITYLFISHDLRVIKFMCGRVAVMKEGKIVEEGPADNLYKNPAHPYTRLLLSSIPRFS